MSRFIEKTKNKLDQWNNQYMLIKDLVPNTGTEQEETNFTVRGLSVNSLSFEINVFTVFVFSNKVFIYNNI